MANKVLLKKSSVGSKIPTTSDLDYGELALNYADGKLYYKTASNNIKSFTEDSSAVTLNDTQTLSNKTLSSPVLSGAVVINGLTYPGADGTNGQVLSTNGAGQLIFATVSEGGVVVGGYNNSSLTSFPAGDYNGTDAFIGASGSAFDAFGVSLLATFTCMDPVGSTQTTDLGVLT